jgi:hypothetical protein
MYNMRFGFIGLATVIVLLFSVMSGCIELKFNSGGGELKNEK